ncbi:MAG: mandelate racemase/muconate lactonizing enzyme family protein [Anaerolineales bacterium]
MQISHVDVTPVQMKLQEPFRTAAHPEPVTQIETVFIRAELVRDYGDAWGCAVLNPIGEETLNDVMRASQACADKLRDLNPLNTQRALADLSELTDGYPAVQCAFDMLLYDLLGLWSGLPLFRLLGGYRDRIPTSITLGLDDVHATVEMARMRARDGFRILKLKGGLNPEEDVRRVRAVHRALPDLTLRLDADQGYRVKVALDVARALKGKLEFLEQPTPADDLVALRQVTESSPIPILADESLRGPASVLEIVNQRAAHGVSTKLATCGGLDCARQVDTVARAGHLSTMVGCLNEPALLIAAGLAFALSSPNVRYGDLDGHFYLEHDPSVPGFQFVDGWLIASTTPGLGCTADL